MQTLHPLFVHFPIALLTLYAGIEIVSLFKKSWKNNTTVLYIKLLLLVTGSIGASIASSTGETVEHLMWRSVLISRHSLFAGMTTNIFWFLTVFYMLKWYVLECINMTFVENNISPKILWFIAPLVKRIEKLYLPLIWALLWLFTVTITGALWGAIVHGAGVDQMVQWAVDTFASGSLSPNMNTWSRE